MLQAVMNQIQDTQTNASVAPRIRSDLFSGLLLIYGKVLSW